MSMSWDGTGKRFYENGVDHGILFISNGDGTYGNGIAWNGLTTVTESPEGAEPNDLWADNMKYATLYSNETFGATIEAYTYPEEFAQCDGSYQPIQGVNFGQQERKAFAFCYRTHVGNDAGLDSYKLHIVYNCKASPSEKSYETINDSPDAITFSWEVSTTPIPHGNIKPISSIIIDLSKLDENGLDIYRDLEKMIYGNEDEPSTLPSTEYIASVFAHYRGNPAQFKATRSKPIDSIKVDIEPEQDLHGYDAPWPMGSRENKLPKLSSQTKNGATIIVADDGTITINGTASEDTYFERNFSVSWSAGDTFRICAFNPVASETGRLSIFILTESSGNPQVNLNQPNAVTTQVATLDTTTTRFRLRVPSGETFTNFVIKPMLTVGETAPSAYEPCSNVCPITGVDSVTAIGMGENLIPKFSSATTKGITITVDEDGTIVANGTASEDATFVVPMDLTVSAGVRCTICAFNPVEGTNRTSLFVRNDTDGVGNYQVNMNSVNARTTMPAATKPVHLKDAMIRIPSGFVASDYVIRPMLVVGTSAPTAYTPYYGITSVTVDLGETVYGGTLDLTNGTCVSNMAYEQMTYSYLSGLSNEYIGYSENVEALGGVNAVWVRDWNYSEMSPKCSGGIKSACNAFPISVHDSDIIDSQNRIYFSVGDMASVEEFLAAVQTLENDNDGLYIAYELAEPVTYDLSDQQLSMLSKVGTNNIFADIQGDLDVTYREDAESASVSGYTKQQLLNLSDPAYVKNLVKIGTASQVFNIGDQFNVTWNDGTTTYECPFDVVHFGKVTDEYGIERNGMYLQSHYAIPGVQFDASEAIYYCDTALSAGTYYFTIGDNWGTGFTKNSVYAFTTTKAIPAGGQIVIGTESSAYNWSGENSVYSSWRVYTYSSKTSTTPLEQGLTLTSGAPVSGGTDLGTISLSMLQRASRGYGRWSQSALRQWLNSSAAAGSWWTPQNDYDRPPEQLSSARGFKAGLPENFLNMVSPVANRTSVNGTNVDSSADSFAPASLEQEYVAPQASGVEGSAFTYWVNTLESNSPQAVSDSGINENHIRNSIADNSSASSVRLRTMYAENAHQTFSVNTNGGVYANNASNTLMVAPYCVVY